MALSKRLRYEVLRRDNHTCRYCGATAPDVALTVDHVTPVALGGADEPTNLVTACRDCNAGKTSSSPDGALVEDVAHDALRWRRAMAEAAAEQAVDRGQRDHDLDVVETRWRGWMPGNWEYSVNCWLDAGLTIDDLVRLIGATQAKPRQDAWKYFCGAAWGTLRQRQERAHELIAAANLESVRDGLRESVEEAVVD
jgi:hypothetical protein